MIELIESPAATFSERLIHREDRKHASSLYEPQQQEQVTGFVHMHQFSHFA